MTDADNAAPVTSPGASAERVSTGCMSCGSPYARSWSTPQGSALLCPPCATLSGIGCP